MIISSLLLSIFVLHLFWHTTILSQAASVIVLSNVLWPDCSCSEVIGSGGCDSEYTVYGNLATKTIRFDNSTFSIQITNYGIYVYAIFNLSAYMPAYVDGCTCWWIFSFCSSMCSSSSDDVNVSGPIVTKTNVTINLDVSPNVKVDISDIDHSLDECDESRHSNLILYWFSSDIQIQDAVQDAINTEIFQQINVPQTFSPHTDINITYSVTQSEFQENNYCKCAKCTLTVRNKS